MKSNDELATRRRANSSGAWKAAALGFLLGAACAGITVFSQCVTAGPSETACRRFLDRLVYGGTPLSSAFGFLVDRLGLAGPVLVLAAPVIAAGLYGAYLGHTVQRTPKALMEALPFHIAFPAWLFASGSAAWIIALISAIYLVEYTYRKETEHVKGTR